MSEFKFFAFQGGYVIFTKSNKMIEHIKQNSETLAIIVSHTFDRYGVHFFTPDEMSQQLAYIKHQTGSMIQPHIHNCIPRKVQYSQEVLILKKGRLRVDFYSDQLNYLESRVLVSGDIILLIKGGHGFEVLEEVEMIEVKQGPYVGELDKTRFSGSRLNSLQSLSL
jgi:mannose-6-phosphate isomerase-like protein (cupin superfamily)